MTNDSSNYDLSNMDELSRTEPPYLGAYGLSEAPFSEQHDDRFLFLTPALSEQLDLLKHYTQYGNLLLIVKGERGIGKSSLKYRFIDTAQEEWQICEIQANTMMTSGILLKDIASGFGITEPPHDAPVLFEVLSSQLEYLHKESYEPILIIDDAHELPQEALQSLLYLAEHHSNQQTALRIILFCEPEIDTMLQDPSINTLKDRVTHSIDIPALNETQVAEYLRHRLAVAGFDGSSPFTPALINKIFTSSKGIPAKINESAHKNLLDDSEPGLAEEEDDVEEKPAQAPTLYTLKNILIGSFALIIILSVLFFQDEINQLFEAAEIPAETITKDNSLNNKIVRTENKTTHANAVKKEKLIELNLDKKEEQNSTPENPTETINNETPRVEEQTAPEIKESVEAKPTLELISVNPNPVATSKQRQIISISGTGFHKRQKVKVSWTGNEKFLSPNQINVNSNSYMNLILNVGTTTDTWSVTVIDPELNITSNTISFNVIAATESSPSQKISTAKVNTRLEKNNGFYGPQWITQQNKNYFTLQLLGSFNKTTLTNYLKKYSLKNDAAIFTRLLKGKTWYTLIYGSYPTKAAAQAEAKTLPKGMAKTWARSFASITPALESQKILSPTKTETTSSNHIPENKEGWLWSQDPRDYTLQLNAGKNEKAIQSYVERHKLQGKAAYFHRLRDGEDWYILIYGRFSGYSKAKQAIQQLPEAIQKTRPWPRSFGAIHSELN